MDLFKTSLVHPDAWMVLMSGYLFPLLLFPLKSLPRAQRCSINFGPLEGERTLGDRCPVSQRCGFCFLLNLSSMPLYNSLSTSHWNPACRVRLGEGHPVPHGQHGRCSLNSTFEEPHKTRPQLNELILRADKGTSHSQGSACYKGGAEGWPATLFISHLETPGIHKDL